MRVVILATEKQKQEIIIGKNAGNETDLIFIKNIFEIENYAEYDGLFLLTGTLPENVFTRFPEKPVVINSVINTLESLKLPFNFSRINGWTGFLERPVWEITSNNKPVAEEFFKTLGWEILYVKDEPGLVSARVLSMIINEAYFALGENVSTINEIDLAMKLGTNYSLGPFEWKARIGLENIYLLLKKLSEKDKRYLISPLLEQEFKKFTLSEL